VTRKFRATRCVHCLSYSDEQSSDHVFPKSWYPLSTPANLEKWQAPSCAKCNHEHGVNENELLIRLGLCVSAEELASLGISNKARRALQPSMARDGIDRQRRLSKRKQILDEIRLASEVPRRTFVPGFEPSLHELASGRHALQLPPARLRLLGRKLICGATYVLHDRSFIEVDHVISVHIVNAAASGYAKNLIDKYGKRVHRGPGIVIGQARTAEDRQSAIFEILIWNRLILHATVVDALAAAADEQSVNRGAA
jgi:hypothetical protein